MQALLICTTGPFGLKIKIGLHPSHSLSFLALSFSCVVMVATARKGGAAEEDASEGVEFLSTEEIEARAQAREKRAAESREAMEKMEASMQGSLDLVKLDMESEMGVFLLGLCLSEGLRKTEAQLSTAVQVLRTADCH